MKKIQILALMTFVFLLGCEKDDKNLALNEENHPELKITVENTNVKTFGIIRACL